MGLIGCSGISYEKLVNLFEKVESTTKRLIINDYLCSFYMDLIENNPESLLPSIYLSINRLGPAYEGIELGLGESLLIKAIAGASGRDAARIRAEVAEKGDLGMVAQDSKNTQKTLFKPERLSVCTLFWQLREIATTSGKDAVQKKIDKVRFLLVSCQGAESKYLVRSLEGKLRIGLAEQSVLIALAQASLKTFYKDEQTTGAPDIPQAVSLLKSIFHEIPNYDIVVPNLLKYGIMSLNQHCHLTAGVPLKPMLAHPTRSISEVLDRFEGIPFTCEYKYDGERAQIHRLPSGKLLIYSRNSEDMTAKYPDVAEDIVQFAGPSAESFVLDCEATAWDVEQKKLLPFQVLTTRKRKDVKAEDVKVKVCLFVFDILYFNGKSLLKCTLEERRKVLRDNFNEVPDKFQFATGMDAKNVEEIESFLADAIKNNCEGLMVKTLVQDSSYEPSVRSRKWLKIKKDYLEGTGDSLDLVVIGGYLGKGKRKGTYGGYLLACYNEDTEEYQAICKIGTGFSDQDLESQFAFFSSHLLDHPKSYYNTTESVKPDIWFEPVQVWEVKAADFSLSPIYTAAIGVVDSNRGISLRFPRFIRIRDDKQPEECTTSTQIAQFYKQQAIMANNGDTASLEDMDY